MKNPLLLLTILNFSTGISKTIELHKNIVSYDVGKKKVQIDASEADAQIFINGKMVGKGSTEALVEKDDVLWLLLKTRVVNWSYPS